MICCCCCCSWKSFAFNTAEIYLVGVLCTTIEIPTAHYSLTQIRCAYHKRKTEFRSISCHLLIVPVTAYGHSFWIFEAKRKNERKVKKLITVLRILPPPSPPPSSHTHSHTHPTALQWWVSGSFIVIVFFPRSMQFVCRANNNSKKRAPHNVSRLKLQSHGRPFACLAHMVQSKPIDRSWHLVQHKILKCTVAVKLVTDASFQSRCTHVWILVANHKQALNVYTHTRCAFDSVIV